MIHDPQTRSSLETSLTAHWLALALLLLFPTATTFLYFVVLSGDDSMSLVYGAGKVLQFAFPLVWVFAVQRKVRILAKNVSKPGLLRLLPRPQLKAIVWGAGFGLLVVVATLAVYYGYFKQSEYLGKTPALITAKFQDMGLTTPGRFFIFAGFLALPHSLLEEYYWRWFAFGQLRRVTPMPWAIAISSLGFMAHHVSVIQQFLQGLIALTLLFSLCVAVGGAVWAWLYQRHGSLYGPWASHFLVDCVIMYLGYDLVQWSALS